MELLTPAGTYNCLVAAVNSGADAVYFAGKGFGARSFAGNFSEDEIRRAAEFCRLRNVRTYLTVNTLVFDRELAELEKFIKVITKAGIDAVIVQDLGVLRVIREMSPDIELHGSTQMTVHSADGVRELEKLGVSRVVLSRELSGKEISEIISNEAESKVVKEEKLSKKERLDLIDSLTKEMKRAASNLDFEKAMELRDIIFDLENNN